MVPEDYLRWANTVANFMTAFLIIWLGRKLDRSR
jgi:hypothetical protein